MISILGAGSWGTTFAKVLADAGQDVLIWARKPEIAHEINENHTNGTYLPGYRLPGTIRATSELGGAVAASDAVVVAVPSQTAREALQPLRGQVTGGVISLMKGIELGTDLRMSQVLSETLDIPPAQLTVLSGPNLSREIAAGQPSACVLACHDIERAREFAAQCATPYFRPYVTDDVVGVELAGAVKNVIALAVGIALGQGYGDNTTATIITRGLAEITRLAVALGGQAVTMAGLAGIGDLAATCSSELSRNHRLGRLVGEGMSLAEATAATSGTAEGVKSCRAVAHLAARAGVEMPITQGVVAVLYEGLTVPEMTRLLLSRPRKDERH